MKLDDETLRAAYRRSTAKVADHVSDASWEALATGGLDAGGREAIAEHIVRCGECARIWRGVDALRAQAEQAPRPLVRRALVPASLVAAAAVLLIVVFRLRSPGPAPDALRGGAGEAVLEPAAPGPDAVRFRWKELERAEGYRVQIFDADGAPVWTSPVVAAPPVDRPASLPPGSYRWRAEALAGGHTVARSPLVPFAVGE